MRLHVESSMDRATAIAKANLWMKENLKPGQFFNAILNPLLQVTVDIKGKGNRLFRKPETLTKRLVYDYSVLIYYFAEEELMPMPVLPLPDDGTSGSPVRMPYEQ